MSPASVLQLNHELCRTASSIYIEVPGKEYYDSASGRPERGLGGTCRRVFKFLGVSDFAATPNTVNVNKRRRFAGFHRFQESGLQDRFGLRCLQASASADFAVGRWNSIETKRERLSPETLAKLKKSCLPQIQELEQIDQKRTQQWYKE